MALLSLLFLRSDEAGVDTGLILKLEDGGAERSRRGCEKLGTVPSAGRLSSIESPISSGARWTVPHFFTAPNVRSSSIIFAAELKFNRAREPARNKYGESARFTGLGLQIGRPFEGRF